MKKIISVLTAIIIGASVLSACGKVDGGQPKRFKEISHSNGIYVVYDTQTNVEYAYIKVLGSNVSVSSLTPLIDADGKPLIYKGE